VLEASFDDRDVIILIQRFVVVRIRLRKLRLPDGTPDPSFGTDGRVSFGFDAPDVYAYPMTVLVQGDGRIVLAGFASNNWDTGTPNGNVAVARLLENGALDPSFGVDGKALIAIDAVPNGIDVAMSGQLLRQGKILLAGRADQLHTAGNMLMQLNSDGTPDSTFGDRGVETHSFVAGDQVAQITTGVEAQGVDFIVGGSASTSSEATSFAARIKGVNAQLPSGHSRHSRPTFSP